MFETTEASMRMTAGVSRAGEACDGIVWTILGQTFVMKQVSDSALTWHATLPPGSFVPPHLHPTQDEFLYMLQGRLDLWLDGEELAAGPGDFARLPMGQAHAIYNKSDAPAECLFTAAPTRRLFELFKAIDNLPDPAEVVRLAALHEVEFLPPPA
jgi:quercetin dioxygenase-like cupin family protein